MEYILSLLALIILGFIFKIVYQSDKHYRWFNNLKPGDRVSVRVFSINCDCISKATITSKPFGKCIKAKLDKNDYLDCETCAEINGVDDKKNSTCWYHITTFNKGNIAKLKE